MLKYWGSTEFLLVTFSDVKESHKSTSRSIQFIFNLLSTILIIYLLFLLVIPSATADSKPKVAAIRIGITPVILHQQLQFLNKWKVYLEHHLKQPVEFIRQDSYGKITTQLLKGELEFGWICGYPYVQHQTLLELIAVPIYNGRPHYQSYLIVSNQDNKTRSFQDLKNTVFAYSDPDSNSGYLYAQYSLIKNGLNAGSFFKKTFYTWQHKNTVEAVAVGLAKAGIIDGYIWDTMEKQGHPLIARTRIASKSKMFGFPPVVSSRHVSADLQKEFQQILLSMAKDTRGSALLEQLNIDGFIQGKNDLFDDIQKMHLYLEGKKHVTS